MYLIWYLEKAGNSVHSQNSLEMKHFILYKKLYRTFVMNNICFTKFSRASTFSFKSALYSTHPKRGRLSENLLNLLFAKFLCCFPKICSPVSRLGRAFSFMVLDGTLESVETVKSTHKITLRRPNCLKFI